MLRDSDDDLHAYIDGALDGDSAFELARALAREPRKAARVEAYRAQALALVALYGHVVLQPVPDRLIEAFRRHAARTNRRRFFEAAAAAALALALLAAGGHVLGLWPHARAAPAPLLQGDRFVPI